MKKLHSIAVRGKTSEWCFPVYVDPRHIEEWRADGLEIHEIYNTIPEWVVGLGMAKVWCFFQDLFIFRNPFA